MTQPATPPEPIGDPDQEGLWDGEVGLEAETASPSAPPDGPAIGPPGRSGRSAAWTQSLTGSASLPGPAGLTFAEVPDRVVAFLLDLIALAVVGVALAIVVGGLFGGLLADGASAGGAIDASGSALNVGAFFVVGIVALTISFLYFSYSWVVLRSTPGMRLLGLRIGDQIDGRAISWDQALVRWLLLGIAATLLTFVVYVPSVVGLALALLGLGWLLVLFVAMTRSPTKQGLHDRLARTILVRAVRRAA